MSTPTAPARSARRHPLKSPSRLGFSSVAVHAGERIRGGVAGDPVTTPIFTTSAYQAESAATLDEIFDGARSGYVYARHGNPTCAALEETVAKLEQAVAAISFGSGMAALHAAVLASDLRAGDVIVSSRDIYGATLALFRDVFYALGVETQYVDCNDLGALADTVGRVKPRVVFVEALSNPLLRVADIPAIVEIAREARAVTIVDSTFATPRLIKPIAWGADFVVHSSTKYLNGHGDSTGGVVACREDAGVTGVRQVSKLVGGVLGPFDAYLTLRGLKTLGLRMPRQCATAQVIAERLAVHPAIAKVHYPGLATHPDAALAARLFEEGLHGAIVSFELANAGRGDVFRFLDSVELCCVAPTAGDVYSQLLYPAIASHRDLTPKLRHQLGISDSLVRLSVGIEDVEDLIADLERALDACRS